jgi:hypothetical protein
VDLHEKQEEPAAVALEARLQLVEQALGPQGQVERKDLPQQAMFVGRVREEPDPVGVEELVAGAPDPLHDAGLDLVFSGHGLRQLEHRHRAGQRAVVELGHGGLHHLVEAVRGLRGVRGAVDDAAHRLGGRGGRRYGRALGGIVGLGQGPARKALPQELEHLVHARVDTEVAKAGQVLVEGRAVGRLLGHGGDDLPGQLGAGRGGRFPTRRRRGYRIGGGRRRGGGQPQVSLVAVQEQGEQARHPRGVLRGLHRSGDGRGLRRGQGGCGHRHQAHGLRRGRGLERGELGLRSHLPVDHRDRRRHEGLLVAQARQVLDEKRAVRLRTVGQHQRGQLPEPGEEGLLRDETEVRQHRDLLDGVEEEIRDRHLRPGAFVLEQGPVVDLGGHETRGLLHEQGYGVGDDEGSDGVGQVLVQVVDGVLDLVAEGFLHAVYGTPAELGGTRTRRVFTAPGGRRTSAADAPDGPRDGSVVPWSGVRRGTRRAPSSGP